MTYRGRFAPSPTGPLHAGSLVAALASWLDARAHGGQWLVRIEDVDTPRCVPGMGQFILGQLAAVGLLPDEVPQVQSQRSPIYQRALDGLAGRALAYPCRCSRKDVAAALALLGRPRQRQGELVYPGTCRHNGTGGRLEIASEHSSTQTRPQSRQQPTWRLRTDFPPLNRPTTSVPHMDSATILVANEILQWCDRRLGPQQQDVEKTVGDFPLKRADGCFTYQLAVVVDDAAQGITHVVRGEDLADNTARQILLQRALGVPTPVYLHTPLVLGANGEKLSKQNSAEALDTSRPLAALNAAAQALGLASRPTTDALNAWVNQWRNLYAIV
jgi:glutamyl-Q tRNA(Asp) synthetase